MDNEKFLKIAVIAFPLLVIIILIIIYSSIKNNPYMESPALNQEINNQFCTNRDNTVTICKGDVICQCRTNSSQNKLFLANKNEECPEDCGALKPASSEGDLGTCNIALIIASDIPLCHANCKGKDISLKARDLANDCCKITIERPCVPA